MKITPQRILPSLNSKKQRRLTLNKKQKIIQVPHTLSNGNLTQILKQRRNKFQKKQLNCFSNSATKSQACGLNLILQVQQEVRSFNKRSRCQSQSKILYKKSSLMENQSQNLIKQINQNLQNHITSKNNQNHLRPCHQKLLKNLLVKQNQQNSNSLLFLTKKKHDIQNNQILNQNNQKENLKQKIDFFNFTKKQNQQDSQINSIQKCQTKYKNIGTMTELSLNNESYNEFMKFKLSQQDAYLKMKEVFNFIDDLSRQECFKFQQRHQNLMKVYNQSVSSQRQNKIIELIKKIESVQSDFTSSFVFHFQKLSKIQEKLNYPSQNQIIMIRNQIFKIKETLKNFNFSNNFSNKSLSPNKQNLILTSDSLKIDLDSKLTKIQKTFIDNHQKHIRIRQKLIHQLLDIKKDLLKKIEAWKSCNQQKNFMIRVCINDLIRLPQLSMVVFGLSKDLITAQEIEIMKKIGINLDEVPQFQEFYGNKYQAKGPEKAFKQLIKVKCLNCAYFKSKMRVIHKTNCQLEPALKILNLLVKEENKKNYDFK